MNNFDDLFEEDENLSSGNRDYNRRGKTGAFYKFRSRIRSDSLYRKKIFKILAVAALVVIALCVFWEKGNYEGVTLKDAETAATEEKSDAEEAASYIYIDIAGAVKKPGVYKVKNGSRVYEVIEKAGGLKKNADTTYINQADKVEDGQKIVVEQKGKSSSVSSGSGSSSSGGTSGSSSGTDSSSGNTSGSTSASGSSSGLININSADSEELQKIPGVGPATAAKIIEYRRINGPFSKPEDIKNVSGIGDKTFEKMKNMIRV